MNYASTSIEPVVAKIIRDTRLKDSTLLPYVIEWVAEALDMLPSPGIGKAMWADRTVDYHRALFPCGMLYVKAIEYNGRRMRRGAGAKAISQDTEKTIPFCNEIEKASTLKYSNHWYDIEPPQSLTTSLRSGTIRIQFYGRASDKFGFPYVPDNANYREAVYWYVRGKMIASGWEDKIMKYGDVLQLHERYAGRAMAEVWYPSIDEMPDKNDLLVRLVPDMSYFDRFEMPEYGNTAAREANTTVGIPITSLIVERMAPNPQNAFPYKFKVSTFTQVFPATQHQLNQVKGVTFLDPDGNIVLVPYQVDAIDLKVTVISTVDLINHTMTIF